MISRTLFCALLTSLCITQTVAAQSRDEGDVFPRTYEFDILEHEAAEALAWEACRDQSRREECRVANASPRHLTVIADRETHARIAAKIAAVEDVPKSQLFQVILLQAENNGDSGLAKIPTQAREALNDAREFLPYSGYKMLGTALLRTDARARSIVNGPDGNDYAAGLSYRNAAGRDGHRLIVREFSLDRIVSVRASSEQAPERIERIPVIGTSFSMKPGETVIVGTSKLEGAERALVVLLTNVQ